MVKTKWGILEPDAWTRTPASSAYLSAWPPAMPTMIVSRLRSTPRREMEKVVMVPKHALRTRDPSGFLNALSSSLTSVLKTRKKRENILVRGENYFSQRSDRTRTSTTARWKATTLNLSKMDELASETIKKKYFRPVECAYLDTVRLRVCEN